MPPAAVQNSWSYDYNDTDGDPATDGFALSKETIAYGTALTIEK